jgi:hypothetical protein
VVFPVEYPRALAADGYVDRSWEQHTMKVWKKQEPKKINRATLFTASSEKPSNFKRNFNSEVE